MPKYQYSAVRDDGERVYGQIEGRDQSAVIGRLGEQGLHPIDVTAFESTVGAGRILGMGGGVASFKEISIFTRELAWLLQAGMSLNDALGILGKEGFSPAFSTLIGAMRTEIRKGRSFHEALAGTGLFSNHYVSMIEAGEASGTLAAVLERTVSARDREQKIRSRLVSALIYPAVLVTLATGAVIFIMISIVPSIKDMISGSGAPVPSQAQFVIDLSDWIIANGAAAAIWASVAALLLVLLLGTDRLRRMSMALAMRLPILGSLLRKSAVVQFCRVLGTLLASGVKLPDSLKLMRPSVDNGQISATLDRMEIALRQGEDFLAPLDQSKFFPSLLARMLRVGNETGNLTPSLLQVTEILEEEFDRSVERAITLLGPVIILVLSIVIAFIISSLMSAIISINDLAL